MRQRRVLITGASGQLGIALEELNDPSWQIRAFTRAELDIRNWTSVRNAISSVQPDLVIHAAAATNVDRCEREPDWAYDVNAVGTRYVAQAAAQVQADLVFVSTNYVFDGTKDTAYHEFDETNPISVYGHSKLAGEREASAATSKLHIVRTASVFAEHGTNFVATMRRLMASNPRITVVDDQFSNPTYARDLAAAIARISSSAPFGTYHVTNSGDTSWHGWATEIRSITGADCDVAPIPASEYRRDASPPANGALQSALLHGLGITLPDWRDALQRCLNAWLE